MFQRTIDGLELRFHLAGINNQNFLMRDEQTGTYWQQITGLSVAGPLKGRRLTLVPADELTLALWKSEHPEGSVLNDVPKYAGEYSDRDWDKKMAKVPTVVSYAQAGLKPRDLMLGIHAFGLSRAVPYEAVLKEKLIQDHMAGEPIPLVLGPDGQSVRAFRQLVPGASEPPEFYRMTEESHSAQTKGSNAQTLMMDAQTGSEWNFQGCAVAGKLKGSCLAQLQMIKDYWFDWRNYNRQTSVYGINRKIQ